MATRSNIYVETEPGAYIGTYCHFDGYPGHMLPALTTMTTDECLDAILIAGLKSGFRTFGEAYLDDTGMCYLHHRDDLDNLFPRAGYGGPEYIYIKQLDGSVKYRGSHHVSWETDG